MVYLPGARRVL